MKKRNILVEKEILENEKKQNEKKWRRKRKVCNGRDKEGMRRKRQKVIELKKTKSVKGKCRM